MIKTTTIKVNHDHTKTSLTSAGDVTTKAIQALLNPLEAVCPQAVIASLQALDAGHSPSRSVLLTTTCKPGGTACLQKLRNNRNSSRVPLEKQVRE